MVSPISPSFRASFIQRSLLQQSNKILANMTCRIGRIGGMILSDGPTHLRDDGVRVWGRASVGVAVEQIVPNRGEKCAKRGGFITETANM